MNNIKTERFEISGIVQGVGFRPFVRNLAMKLGLSGFVLNNPDGVVTEVSGIPEAIDSFEARLKKDAPPLAKIIAIKRKSIEKKTYSGFEIRQSEREGKPIALIPPDICVCPNCLREMFSNCDRRYLYPFINCTDCGPRFTIIKGIPYDRPYTTMSGFTMCPDCLSEYENPSDRRYHAQPNACPVCGPRLELIGSDRNPVSGDPISEAIKILKGGGILAVKGIGGFHLAVDGLNDDAVKLLRGRKHREEKPLALMAPDIETAETLVKLSEKEKRLITGIERPIVLAISKHDSPSAESVAPGNPYLGIMLPYTPIHYLLFFHPEAGGDFHKASSLFTALVMTSGNLSEEPICRDNDEALDRLSGIADAFLIHNRGIYTRCDDSVVRFTEAGAPFMRRSRGFVPVPVFLKEELPPVLALGGELKSTICMTEGRRAFPSQHIGDLENIASLDFFGEVVEHFKKLFDIDPKVYACDLHPEYLSSKYMQRIISENKSGDIGTVKIQHHHAHIAGVLAEHGTEGPVIGLAFDGTGYGSDNTVWGGEILVCNPYSFARAANLSTIPLPGGEKAIKEPWRTAFSYLKSAFGYDWRGLDLECLKQEPRETIEMLNKVYENRTISPLTSSMGRLFDAVSSIIGIKHHAAYEGQAAFLLEMAAYDYGTGDILPYNIIETVPDDYPGIPVTGGKLMAINLSEHAIKINFKYLLNFNRTITEIVNGLKNGTVITRLAADFHETIAQAVFETVLKISGDTGIRTAAFSGGCFQNRILSERLYKLLTAAGIDVLTHSLVPVNDGGLSLGQAYIAAKIAKFQMS